MMKLSIPADWDGVSWCRFAVCWPDSLQWRNLLLGFITQPTRGRFWDETTGSIRDVQQIGWQITDGSIPLKEVIVACGDSCLGDLITVIQAQQAQLEAIVTALGQIRTAIELTSPSILQDDIRELEDDLANVWGVLKSINEVIGGENDPPPTPL